MNTTLLEHLLALSRKMAETRDIDELLNLAIREVLDIVGGEFGYLVLLGPGPENELQFRVRCGDLSHDTNGHDKTDVSYTIFNDVIRSGEPRIIDDALSDSRYQEGLSVINLQIRSVMCVPLIARGKILGAIYVENRKVTAAFHESDLEPFIFFANQAAVSIENALLINNLETLVAERTAEVESSWREAVEANRLRTTLFSQLAHDMRTPASAVKLSLSMLNNPKYSQLSEQQAEWVERAIQANNHMTHLVQNVFDLSKLELGTLELSREDVDLAEFLESVYDIGAALPWEDTVQFTYQLPANLPPANIDPMRIQQVLLNLIGNALKFTESGQVTLYATVIGSSRVRIGVRDTGEGIPDEQKDHVFDRFQQFDADSNRRLQGAGLGLAICRDLVEKHDGRIFMTSVLGEGSDFAFTLPL